MKYIVGIIAVFLMQIAFAGGSSGTGTPPALQDLQQELMMKPSFGGGLFDKGGDIGLLTRVKLQPQMLVGSGMGGGTPPILSVSESDLALLRDRTKPLDTVNTEGGSASYNIEAGETLNTVILHDRREAMRSAVK
jgi:hypothetical protein